MKSYIHLIRHGLTEGNTKRWFYGATDVPLLEEGVEDLAKLRKEGIYPVFEEADFYTSGMLRTKQTLETIYGPVPFRIIDDLREMNFGRWECKTFEELKMEPEAEEWMKENNVTFCYPGGGESQVGFRSRVHDGLHTLLNFHAMLEVSQKATDKDANTVAVCHGGVISAILHQLFPEEKHSFWDWIPDPGHGYTVELKNGKAVSWKAF